MTYPGPSSFELIFYRHRFAQPVHLKLDLGETFWRDALDRLPVEREIPWEFDAHERAEYQRQKRRQLCNYVANQLTTALLPKIMEALESKDTENGYERISLTGSDQTALGEVWLDCAEHAWQPLSEGNS